MGTPVPSIAGNMRLELEFFRKLTYILESFRAIFQIPALHGSHRNNKDRCVDPGSHRLIDEDFKCRILDVKSFLDNYSLSTRVRSHAESGTYPGACKAVIPCHHRPPSLSALGLVPDMQEIASQGILARGNWAAW